MKWRNYFCDDVVSGGCHKFPSCSNSCNLYRRIPGTFWSYYAYICLRRYNYYQVYFEM